jgi:excinuclease ABC subunit C
MKSGEEIIYVGKAKNLKNRVRQYFQSARGHTPKVQAMVEKVTDFEIVLVDGELEALILESNLIKKYQPYYNILLKDDKHYPFISIDLRLPFPRAELKRRQQKDGARYFGPYPGASIVREVLDVVRVVFPIRTCARAIRLDRPQRPCVHYEIGQCLAPCAGKCDEATYRKVIDRVLEFLGGKQDAIVRELTGKMQAASDELNFERAAIYRDRLHAVTQVMQKQKAIVTTLNDQDVIVAMSEGVDALVQLLYMRGGRLIGTEHYVLKNAADEAMGDLLTSFILQHYSLGDVIPRTILLDAEPSEAEVLARLLSEEKGAKVTLAVPVRGDKRKLMEMARKNLVDEAEKRAEKLTRSYERTTGALAELQKVLSLDKLPRRIEGYDISNTQGVLSVGSMVVMIDGVSAPKEYRHFRIKTVEGANDFASMQEVIARRLRHGLDERAARAAQGLGAEGGKFSSLPDLLLIDGGKGQLNAALEAMRGEGVNIPAFGLAKRLEEIVLPDADESILLDRHSEALHLIQRLRDEAHRFGVSHHRKLRAKQSVASILDGVPGVGPTRKKALLTHFKSIEALRSAPIEELYAVKGMNKPAARAVYDALHVDAPTGDAGGV